MGGPSRVWGPWGWPEESAGLGPGGFGGPRGILQGMGGGQSEGPSGVWGPWQWPEGSDRGRPCGVWGVWGSLGDPVGLGHSRGPSRVWGPWGALRSLGEGDPGGPWGFGVLEGPCRVGGPGVCSEVGGPSRVWEPPQGWETLQGLGSLEDLAGGVYRGVCCQHPQCGVTSPPKAAGLGQPLWGRAPSLSKPHCPPTSGEVPEMLGQQTLVGPCLTLGLVGCSLHTPPC